MAAAEATSQGRALGYELLAGEYTNIHLIGHSAGSWLIDAAADVISQHQLPSGDKAEVQLTLLDAYAPLPDRLGDTASFAEQYVDGSPEDAIPHIINGVVVGPYVYQITNRTLPNAFNIDVTNADGSPSVGLTANHGWPITWYWSEGYDGGSVIDSSPFGFSESTVLGTMPEYGDVRGGVEIAQGERVYINGAPHQVSDSPTLTLGTARVLADLMTFTSTTGLSTIAGTALNMRTGSPVWSTSVVDFDGPQNLLFFDADFISQAGAEGVLSVFLDGELLGTIDERYALDSMSEYQMFLPGTMGSGVYELSFRLDPYTEVDSEIAIDNVRFGYAAIPEPASLVLLAIGGSGLLFHRRRAA
jgi:hypothetical protein